MKKIHYNKLVRDKIPVTIHKRGSDSKTRRLNKREFLRELFKKVEEEASAFPKLKTNKGIASEMADLVIVLNAIRAATGISKHDLDQAIKENKKRKGGFAKRLFLYWSSDDGYKSNEKRRA